MRPLDSSAYPKYDNMGRRITASGGLGGSNLSLPDEERYENETLFGQADGQPTGIPEQSQDLHQPQEATQGQDKGGGPGEFVSL